MTRKTRTVLFFICVFLFLVSAGVVVFYSQGYRFNFENKKVAQTGAFYFKVLPKSSQIYLNGQLKKETDFIFGSALIENLLPKTYNVQIKKEGYISWEKTLEIKEKQVTEAKNIVLIPEKLSFTALEKDGQVKDFFFSPDKKKIILEEIRENGWQISLYDLKNNVKSYLIAEKDITKFTAGTEADFLSLKFSPDSKRILLKVSSKKAEKYFILELEKNPPRLISLGFLGTDIEDISFNPQTSQKIFFTKISKKKNKESEIFQTDLFEADLESEKISQTILSNLITYGISEENIFFISNEGFLFKTTDLSGKKQEKLSLSPFFLKKEEKLQLLVNSSEILLKEGDNLYFFIQDSKEFKKLSISGNSFSFSPDFKKIVYFNNYEIWILFLKEKLDQPPKKAGEEAFLTRFSEEIGQVLWLTDHYLIFNTGNKIKIAEIDDRDKINIVDLFSEKEQVEFKNSKIFWSKKTKKLYILSEENLLISEKITP